MEEIDNNIDCDIALVGGGPSSLMAATLLLGNGFKVCIFEQGSSMARKLNVAAKSGLNLSNDKQLDDFIQMYGEDKDWIRGFIEKFSSIDLRKFLQDNLGVETYVGSSGKIFPKNPIKGSKFIKNWVEVLQKRGLHIFTHHQFIGWEDTNCLKFIRDHKEPVTVKCRASMLALGGVSWPMTGSNGKWTTIFEEIGIELIPWQASNCGVFTDWDRAFFDHWEGHFIKNINLSFGTHSCKGELRITSYGLEGKPIYHLVPAVRKELSNQGVATVFLDLKPSMSLEDILTEIQNLKERSLSLLTKKLAIHPSFPMLMKLHKLNDASDTDLAQLVKYFPVQLKGLSDIENVISVTGGVAKSELTSRLMLKKMPSNYVAGEMIDWDAPTGGYLIHACFAQAKTVAESMIEDLKL